MNDLTRHHYKVWEAWGKRIRGDTITEDNIPDQSPLHQETFFFIDNKGQVLEQVPPTPEDTFYVKCTKSGINYIIPVRFLNDLPLKPTKTTQIRLKRGDTKVYQFITERETLKIPSLPFINIKKFVIEEFNPIPHSNTTHDILLKLIAICPELKIGVCGNVAVGKNAHLTVLKHMIGKYAPKIIKPTQAKLWSIMKYNDYVNLDEITSWSAEHVHNIEDLFAAGADESPDMEKYALDRNKQMEVLGLSQKSLTFTFNRPDELDKIKGIPFEKKFENPAKIMDRFPRLLFNGKSIGQIDKPNIRECKELVDKHFKEMCRVAAKAQYLRESYMLHLHGWNRSNVGFERRHLANIKPLIDMLDVISETQDEFNDWIKELTKCKDDYLEMISDKTQSFVINKDYSTDNQDGDLGMFDLSGGK